MNRAIAILTALQLAFAAAAAAGPVRYDYDPQADFAAYRAYAWSDDAPGPGVDELADRRLRTAIEAELEAKGLHAAPPFTADLMLSYQAAVARELRVDESWGGPPFGRDLRIDTYESGTLVLDIRDAASSKLIWRGSVSKALQSGKTDPERQQKRLQKAVSQLLASFPPEG